MFPFDRPSDYGEMLNKIGIFSFFSSLGVIWYAAKFSPPIARVLESQSTTVEIQGVHVPFLYALVAIAIAASFRAVRLHDRISDAFGIRARFDVDQILTPLCEGVGITVNQNLATKLTLHRESVMQKTYYQYASFEDPKISKALVLASTEVWTWYWILLEFMALATIAHVLLFVMRAAVGAALAFVVLCVGILLFCTHTKVCGKKAQSQVEV
jgi:hypothetical protein